MTLDVENDQEGNCVSYFIFLLRFNWPQKEIGDKTGISSRQFVEGMTVHESSCSHATNFQLLIEKTHC